MGYKNGRVEWGGEGMGWNVVREGGRDGEEVKQVLEAGDGGQWLEQSDSNTSPTKLTNNLLLVAMLFAPLAPPPSPRSDQHNPILLHPTNPQHTIDSNLPHTCPRLLVRDSR